MTTLINNLDHKAARTACARFENRPDALLEILHDVQGTDGYLSDEALRTVADALNISRADIHGVVSFYHDYRRAVPPKHTIQICRAEACQAVGCDSLSAHVEKSLGVSMGSATADNNVGLSAVYCLGNCALGPAVMIDGDLYGRMTPERLDDIVSAMSKATT